MEGSYRGIDMYQGISGQCASSRIELKAQTPLQINVVHKLVGGYTEVNLCASSIIAVEQIEFCLLS